MDQLVDFVGGLAVEVAKGLLGRRREREESLERQQNLQGKKSMARLPNEWLMMHNAHVNILKIV